MKYDKENYKQVVDEYTPKNKILKNCVWAFIFGGIICLLGEIIKNIFVSGFNIPENDAGTVVPITGFANSVVSPALEYKREGLVLGTAANIFKLAGPVLVYGYLSAFIVGILSLIFG